MINPEHIRTRVKRLPSLPNTIVALGEAISDDRCTADRLLDILATDPPLSASMLRLANSGAYGGQQRVTDLRTAILRLGQSTILNIGRSTALIRNFRNAFNLDPTRLWQHSVAVGLTAKGICGMLGKRNFEESSFLAGLLHDIGKIALDTCFTQEYAPVAEAIKQGEFCIDAEQRILGVTHATVGAIVGEEWRFADVLVETIRDHHAPPPQAFIANLIHLCDLLVRTRIPNGPADERLAFSLESLPAFQVVFPSLPTGVLDLERLTFSIDDEVDHAINFVQLAFQD